MFNGIRRSWVKFELLYKPGEYMDGKIHINIPQMCVICGSENIKDFINLKSGNFLGGKRYIKIPLCAQHYDRQKFIDNKWFLSMPLTIQATIFFFFLFIKIFFYINQGYIDLVFPLIRYLSWIISSLTAIIIIGQKVYTVKYGVKNFIVLKSSKVDKEALKVFIRGGKWAQIFENLNNNRFFIQKNDDTKKFYVINYLKMTKFVILLSFILLVLSFSEMFISNYTIPWFLTLIMQLNINMFIPLVLLLDIFYGTMMVFYLGKSKKGKLE